MTELLTLVDIRDMHLDCGTFQRAYAVLKCDARMGVCPGIQYDAVIAESHLLQLVDKLTLDVALIVVYLHVRILCTQFGKILLE